MEQKQNTSRGKLIILVAVLVAIAWGWQVLNQRAPALAFTPIPHLPGWQSLETGQFSSGAAGAVFLGIGDTAPPPLPPQDLCQTLFPTPGTRLAIFTDINCPNCRSLEAKLVQRDLPLNWLQLPLLGPGSETAARLAIAAETLADHPAAPARKLRGTGREALLRHYAKETGLPAATLKTEAQSPRTGAILARHRRAADTLGIPGTPALMIGKTLILGDLRAADLDRLLAMDLATCD